MFVLVAPALFAASIYMTLGRIILSVRASNYSMVRPNRLTITFVTGDVASFLIQGGSSGLMVIQRPGLAKWGERLAILGLMIQVIMFGLFFVITVVFHQKLRRAPTPESYDVTVPWEQILIMLYAVSVLIMIRSIFRVIEFAQGQAGYSLSHEWTMYIFDSILMFIVTILFGWRFPSGLIPREASYSMENHLVG